MEMDGTNTGKFTGRRDYGSTLRAVKGLTSWYK